MIRKYYESCTVEYASESFQCFHQREELLLMYGVVLLCGVPFARPKCNDVGILRVVPLADISSTTCQTAIGRNIYRRGTVRVV
jgi:hypothetical protein